MLAKNITSKQQAIIVSMILKMFKIYLIFITFSIINCDVLSFDINNNRSETISLESILKLLNDSGDECKYVCI